MENRRFLTAALLSALLMVVWYQIFPPPVPVTPPTDSPAVVENSPETSDLDSSASEDPSGAPVGADPDAPEAAGEQALEEILAENEQNVVLENDRIRLEFSNLGAVLTSALLKQHFDEEGKPLQLVRDRGSDPHPFAIVIGGERSHRLNRALFTVEESTDDEGNSAVRFQHRSDLGGAEKTFFFDRAGFLQSNISLEGVNNGWGILLGPGIGSKISEADINRMVSYRQGGDMDKIAVKEDEVQSVFATGLDWIALENNFFLAAVIPQSGLGQAIVRPVLQRQEFKPEDPRFLPADYETDEETTPEQILLLESLDDHLNVQILLSAKEFQRLAALPHGLEETLRWGWFGALIRPLYFALEWVYARGIFGVHNYGWAIVLVTCFIKLLFLPLTWKSQESMGKMQQLSPKIKAIQAKYKPKLKDKNGRPNLEAQKAMQDEVQAIYRAAGVNPIAGCIPILLQMPVFFAFFRLLSTSIELRNAPWIGWIKDLSSPDPIFLLPIIMGASSLGMQKMLPSSPDPMQRRLMQMMPIMFMFFAFAFPSGLVLYWVTNNILTMIQQYALNKVKARREAASTSAKSQATA